MAPAGGAEAQRVPGVWAAKQYSKTLVSKVGGGIRLVGRGWVSMCKTQGSPNTGRKKLIPYNPF